VKTEKKIALTLDDVILLTSKIVKMLINEIQCKILIDKFLRQ